MIKSRVIAPFLWHWVKVIVFGLFGVFSPTRQFSLIWRCRHFRWRATNFDLYSALKASEMWGFFNVPHLLWPGPTLCNGHIRGHTTFTPVVECLELAMELSLYLSLTFRSVPTRDRAPISRMRGERIVRIVRKTTKLL